MADDSFEYDVFISYCHENKAMIFEKIVRPLEDAGLYVWWDGALVEPGSPLLKQVKKGIKASRRVLVVLTKEYSEAKSGWLEFEALIACTMGLAERRQRVLIIRIGGVSVPDWLEGIDAYFDISEASQINDDLIPKITRIARPEAISAFRFTRGGSVLAIGSHWDDILLGCLGTLIKLKELYAYDVDVLVLCTSYNGYYGEHQHDLDVKVQDVYKRLSDAAGFNDLNGQWRDRVRHRIVGERLQDQSLHEHKFHVGNLIGDIISESRKERRRPYNVIFSPPANDEHPDHADTGAIVFTKFRDPKHSVLQYPIKGYSPAFFPNLFVSLDDPMGNSSGQTTVAQQKVHLVVDECRFISPKDPGYIQDSERLFSAEALYARLLNNALEYGKNKAVKYAEIFSGRFEV